MRTIVKKGDQASDSDSNKSSENSEDIADRFGSKVTNNVITLVTETGLLEEEKKEHRDINQTHKDL